MTSLNRELGELLMEVEDQKEAVRATFKEILGDDPCTEDVIEDRAPKKRWATGATRSNSAQVREGSSSSQD